MVSAKFMFFKITNLKVFAIFSYKIASTFTSNGCFGKLIFLAFKTPLTLEFWGYLVWANWTFVKMVKISENRVCVKFVFSKVTISTVWQISPIKLLQNSKVRDVLKSWDSLHSETPLTFEFWGSFVWDISVWRGKTRNHR